MLKMTFLILNYKNVSETILCINSIKALNISHDQVAIVVVDNGSEDNSVCVLEELQKDTSNMVILPLEKNLGFSKGNNIGYTYIKENLESEFIVVTNNDILFPQKDLYERLRTVYNTHAFHVLGPDIYVRANKEHQSPLMLKLPQKEDYEKELNMYRYYFDNPKKWARRRNYQNKKNYLYNNNCIFRKAYDLLKKRETIDKSLIHENACVQGACIIISHDFLMMENKMFSPETFLYCEEILLYHKCLKNKYSIVYNPNILVWHEDSSTMKKIKKNAVDRAKFTLKYHVESRKIVYKELFGSVK